MRWELQAAPESAALARDLVREGLGPSSKEVESTAVLLTDELVANAVLHGIGPLELAVCIDESKVRVAVSDAASASSMSIDPEPGSTRTSGRGLFLVDALASRWGVRPSEEGKQVWFELDFR